MWHVIQNVSDVIYLQLIVISVVLDFILMNKIIIVLLYVLLVNIMILLSRLITIIVGYVLQDVLVALVQVRMFANHVRIKLLSMDQLLHIIRKLILMNVRLHVQLPDTTAML